MKITKEDREKLRYYLTEFYKHYPQERYTIFHCVKYFKRRINNNKDAWIGQSGVTSSGKSLHGIMFGTLFGRPFDLEKNIAYIPKGTEINDMFDKLNKQVLMIDEAARELRAINFASKMQQTVTMKAATDRFKSNIIIMNLPTFSEFTKSLREGTMLFRFVIPYRTKTHARVIVQMKSRNWRSDDPWGDELANKLYEKAEKKYGEINNELILKIEKSLPNTVMDYIIPNLELILPEISSEYVRLKTESREKSNEEEPSKKDNKWKNKYEESMTKIVGIMYRNELNLGKINITKGDLSTALGISRDMLNKYLKLNEEKRTSPKNFRTSKSPTQIETEPEQTKSPIIPQKANNISFTLDHTTGKERKSEE